MLGMRGHEDHARRVGHAAQRGRQLHAVGARQADVQQQQIAGPSAQQRQCLVGIAGFADDLGGRIGAILQQRAQAQPSQRLVVHQQDAQGGHRPLTTAR